MVGQGATLLPALLIDADVFFRLSAFRCCRHVFSPCHGYSYAIDAAMKIAFTGISVIQPGGRCRHGVIFHVDAACHIIRFD